jgi:hypothetical protein
MSEDATRAATLGAQAGDVMLSRAAATGLAVRARRILRSREDSPSVLRTKEHHMPRFHRERDASEHADAAAGRALALLALFASDDAIGRTLAALSDLGDEEAGGVLASLLPDDDQEGGE